MRKLACLLVAGALMASARPARASHVDLAAPATATAAAASAPSALLAQARTLASEVWSWVSPDDAEVAILLLTGVATFAEQVDTDLHAIYAGHERVRGSWHGRRVHAALRTRVTKGNWGVHAEAGAYLENGTWRPAPENTVAGRESARDGQIMRLLLGWEGDWIGAWLGVARLHEAGGVGSTPYLADSVHVVPGARLRLGPRVIALRLRAFDGGEHGNVWPEASVGLAGEIARSPGTLRWSIDVEPAPYIRHAGTASVAWEGRQVWLVVAVSAVRSELGRYSWSEGDERQVTIGLGGRL